MCIVTFTLLFASSAGADTSIEYDSLSLQPMPISAQRSVVHKLKELNLKRAFIRSQGSKVLKLNMLFTDHYMSSKVALKFDISGNYKLNKFYKVASGFVYHLKIQKKEAAIYFENTTHTQRVDIISKLKSIRVSNFSFSLISKAHAADESCSANIANQTVDIDTSVANRSSGSILSECMSGLLSGVEDSTVGVVESIWDGASSEAKKLWNNPGKRLGEYWGFVSSGAKKLWSFAETLGNMLINPAAGMKILKQKFGQIGKFFSDTYSSVKAMPNNQKAQIICNILGSIGVDVLITAITVGAGSGKLALTITRLLFKLKKIASILGKGLKIPFKFLEKLSEQAIKKIKLISDQGNSKLLERKLKAVGCAI